MQDLHLGLLFILGIGVFGGILGACVFQRIRIPQVVGYIAIGLLVGESGLKLIRAADVQRFSQLNFFALGIIGFLVGGELQAGTFKRYGRQFVGILLGEGLLAFVLVGVMAGVVTYLVTDPHNFTIALASGIVFGAIASATDPASTIDVLWEYRAAGVLTTALVATVALDDALAMTLYGLGTATAGMLVGGDASLLGALQQIGIELFGSLALGAVAAAVLNLVLRYLREPEKALALAIGTLLLVIALAVRLKMDVILATMTLGVVLINVAPLRSKQLFTTMRSFSTPIYVIFFVLVGARLGIGNMPGWLWAVVAVYLVGRTGGKMFGTWLGARATGAAPAVRKYGGMGLFAQGGVAIGLSIMATQHLDKGITLPGGMSLGDAIIFTVTTTTLIVQVLGPPMVKLAIKLADEIGRDVNEQDIVADLKVRDVMSANVAHVRDSQPLTETVKLFGSYDHMAYPVVTGHGNMIGVLALDCFKNLLTNQDTFRWVLAADVMLPVRGALTADDGLARAMASMEEMGLDQIPVVDAVGSDKPVGMLDLRRARQQVKQRLIAKRQSTPAEPAEKQTPAVA